MGRARVGDTVGMTGLGVDAGAGRKGWEYLGLQLGLAVVSTVLGDLEGKIWGEGELSSRR